MENKDQKRIEITLQILEEYAKNKQQVYYQELYIQVGLNRENANDRRLGANLLAEVNKRSIDKNDTLLSSLVTLKNGNEPAEGFFEFAVELKKIKVGANEDEKMIFWTSEVKKIFKVYDNSSHQ